MKKILLFASITFAFSNQVCIDFNKIDINKLAKEKTKFLPSYVKVNTKDLLKKELFFAKKYTQKDKALIAKLGAVELLYEAYKNELIKKYSPNDKVIKSFYEEYKDNFSKTIQVNLSSIRVKSVLLADKIYSQLQKNPSEFDKLAKKYSLDDTIHYKNISLDKFAFNVRNFIETAKLKEISKPIKVGEFYYIDRIDAKKTITPTYKNLKPQLKKLLVEIYVKNLMKKMYEDAEWKR